MDLPIAERRYAGMFYAITGMVLVLLIIGVVFTAVCRLPLLGGRDRATGRSSPPTPVLVRGHGCVLRRVVRRLRDEVSGRPRCSPPDRSSHRRRRRRRRRRVAYGVTAGRHPGHHRADLRASPRSSCWPASTSTSATPTSRRWTRPQPPSRPPPARRPGPASWPIVAGVGAVLLVVGLVTYPVVFMFGIVVLLAAAVEWMVAGVERAGVGRRRVQRRASASRIANPLGVPGARRRSALGDHRLLVQPDHAVAVEDERTGRCSASSPRSCSASASCSPSGRRLAPSPSCAASARSALVGLVAGGAAAALAGERAIRAARDHRRRSPRRGGATLPTRPRPTRTRRRSVAAKANVMAADHAERRRHAHGARRSGCATPAPATTLDAARARRRPTSCSATTTTRTRRLVLDLGTRAGGRRRRRRRARCPNQVCTALDRGRRQRSCSRSASPSPQPGVGRRRYRFFVPGVDRPGVAVVVP